MHRISAFAFVCKHGIPCKEMKIKGEVRGIAGQEVFFFLSERKIERGSFPV